MQSESCKIESSDTVWTRIDVWNITSWRNFFSSHWQLARLTPWNWFLDLNRPRRGLLRRAFLLFAGDVVAVYIAYALLIRREAKCHKNAELLDRQRHEVAINAHPKADDSPWDRADWSLISSARRSSCRSRADLAQTSFVSSLQCWRAKYRSTYVRNFLNGRYISVGEGIDTLLSHLV